MDGLASLCLPRRQEHCACRKTIKIDCSAEETRSGPSENRIMLTYSAT